MHAVLYSFNEILRMDISYLSAFLNDRQTQRKEPQMKKTTIALMLLLGMFWAWNPVAAQTVQVGGYDFPPFVEKINGKYVGITLDMIDALNQFQHNYQFTFVSTAPKRRYKDFDEKKFDIIMFEDKSWGWQDKSIDASSVFLKGGGKFISPRQILSIAIATGLEFRLLMRSRYVYVILIGVFARSILSMMGSRHRQSWIAVISICQ